LSGENFCRREKHTGDEKANDDVIGNVHERRPHYGLGGVHKVGLYNAVNVSIPAAVSVFPGENYEAPRSWTERAYHKLIYYNKVDKGGHFAAWEQPQLFSEEVRAGLRSLRT
jgi:hypothetical protein